MSDNIVPAKKRSPEEYLRHLKENGMKQLTELDPKNNDIAEFPAWLNMEKFKRAKEVCKKYYVGIQFSSFTGLLLILQIPDGLEPLLSTGNSKDLPALYKRYLSTIIHVRSWYEQDIFNPETKAYKSIRQVRSMHRRVGILMNEKFQVPDTDGKKRVWLNQYDMAMTQFAFIGLATIYPRKSGLIAASIDDLELINYYWRVLGHYLGIKDEFNLCSFDSYDELYQVHKLLFEEEYKKALSDQECRMGLEMTQAICEALHFYMPLLTFNNLAHWWQDCFSFNGHKPQPQTFKEKLLAAWMKLSFDHMLNRPYLLVPFANLHKRQFERRLKKKDQVYNKLVDKCKREKQEGRFMSERVDYLNKSQASCPFRVDTAYASHFKQQADTEAPVAQPGAQLEGQVEINHEDMNGNCLDGERQARMVKSGNETTTTTQAEGPDSYPVMPAPPIVSPC